MHAWGKILVQSTWIVFLLKATLIIATGGLLTTVLAKGTASLRYHIWTVVFVLLALLPIIHFGFTGWKLPLVVEEAGYQPVREVPVAVTGVSHESAAGIVMKEVPVVSSATAKSKSTALKEGASPAAAFPKTGIFLAIWLLGALFLILRLMLGRIQAHRLFRRAFPLDDDGWSFVIRFVKRQIGIQQNTEVAAHPDVPIPLTFGTVRPVVMLPGSADEWTMERRQIVLLHEFAHIRHRDDLARLAARAVTVLYWFHPLAWLAFRKFKGEQEKSCDERVIRCGIRPSDYASHLVDLAQNVNRLGGSRPLALAGAATLGMARKPELEGRLSEILNHFPQKETGMKLKITGMFFVIVFGVLMALQPVAKAAEMAPDPVVAVPAAPAKVAKVKTAKKPASPKTPAKAPKAPKEPKAPKKHKVICKKIVTTVTDDGDGKVFIIKDGDKVQKIHVNAAGEKENVIFLGDDGDKNHNVFVMKDFEKEYKTQMKAAMVELKQAMEMLAQKKRDLAKLNREMARSMSAMKVDSATAKVQLKKAMEKLDVKLKAQMEKNEAAMRKLKEANRKLAGEMQNREFKWVEREKEAHARQMEAAEAIQAEVNARAKKEVEVIAREKMKKLEELKAREIEVRIRKRENDSKLREAELKKLEAELARKNNGKTLVWVDEDDVDGNHDVKVLHSHGDHLFVNTDGDAEMRIKLRIETKGVEKKDRKKIDKALKKFERDLPKGVKVDKTRNDDGVSMNINVPEGTKLTEVNRDKLNAALEKLMDTIRDIKGDSDADVREIRIEKKKTGDLSEKSKL